MADEKSGLSPKLIAGAVLILALAGFAYSQYSGAGEDTTPPSPTYEALMAEKASEGYQEPPTRTNMGTYSTTGSARLSGAEEEAQEEPEGEQNIDRKKRKKTKKKSRRESKKDEHGIERFDDGTINRKKMPPMGG